MGVLIDMFTRGGPVRPKDVLAAVARDPACCKDVDTATGNTPLHFTCCNGAPIELVRALLRAYPGAASVEDGDGNLPLHGACSCGAAPDVIMLDNFSLADLRQAVRRVDGRLTLEASGGVDLTTVRGIAETGVDVISVGALTHSAPVLDIGLDAL